MLLETLQKENKWKQGVREAEKRYRALFDQAPVGILIIDPETARAS